MKKTRIETLYEFLNRFETMGYEVTGGLYADEFELYESKPQFKENSIFFTEYQVVNAIIDGGFLRIINNIKDEPQIVDIILEQMDFEYYIDFNEDIWVRGYLNELKLNYKQQRASKNEILERATNI